MPLTHALDALAPDLVFLAFMAGVAGAVAGGAGAGLALGGGRRGAALALMALAGAAAGLAYEAIWPRGMGEALLYLMEDDWTCLPATWWHAPMATLWAILVPPGAIVGALGLWAHVTGRARLASAASLGLAAIVGACFFMLGMLPSYAAPDGPCC